MTDTTTATKASVTPEKITDFSSASVATEEALPSSETDNGYIKTSSGWVRRGASVRLWSIATLAT
jgi:hypothetical protein